MSKSGLRVGILTSGGDCSGLNAVIRSVAKSLMLNQEATIIGIKDGFLGLIEQRATPLTYQDCSGILSSGGTILGTCNNANPFNYNGQDVSASVVEYYHKLDLHALVVIGGDGSLSVSHLLSKLGMNIVGVPKTIDNDLWGTDRTFGFDTATTVVTDALDRLQTTGQSHKRLMILETMGRYAGWIALHGGMAGGADVILLPEFPYDIDEVARACEKRMCEKHYSILVVAEGAKPKNGELTVRERVCTSHDPLRLGGIAEALKQQLAVKLDAEIRATTLGHIQRGGSPSSFDRVFATNLGCYAASLVAQNKFGLVAVIQNNQMTSLPLEKVANKTRLVTTDDQTFISARALGVSFGVVGDNFK
ncbi:ATP-dependent 6-phosphofructokinase [Paraglaciecola aquimarina]|uniref:ATP-dependent 6-phosphofructokinase n=1 Tax=Paraglaciecola algarum TaxID=3050085 RepID=A0ABS9D8B9_9ALTE|nr:ATP-dependent 6-phosphofructokinase [Paraglaciecola sp. G1-23]